MNKKFAIDGGEPGVKVLIFISKFLEKTAVLVGESTGDVYDGLMSGSDDPVRLRASPDRPRRDFGYHLLYRLIAGRFSAGVVVADFGREKCYFFYNPLRYYASGWNRPSSMMIRYMDGIGSMLPRPICFHADGASAIKTIEFGRCAGDRGTAQGEPISNRNEADKSDPAVEVNCLMLDREAGCPGAHIKPSGHFGIGVNPSSPIRCG